MQEKRLPSLLSGTSVHEMFLLKEYSSGNYFVHIGSSTTSQTFKIVKE
jgi:hypothetical protein